MHLQRRRPWFNPYVGKIPWRRDRLLTPVFLGFPGGSGSKEFARNAGDLGSIPKLGRSPGSWIQDMAVHSSIPAWRIPMNRGAEQAPHVSTGSQRVGCDCTVKHGMAQQAVEADKQN